MNTFLDPQGMARGRTLNGAMDGLMDLATGPVSAAVKAAIGKTPQVTRYRTTKPNVPGIWHERRPGRVQVADTHHDLTEIFVAVTFAIAIGDAQRSGEQLEEITDAALVIYRTELAKRGALNWVHSARITNLEPPTPTVIDTTELLTAGLVIRVRLLAPTR